MSIDVSTVQAACNPERSRGRCGAGDRPGNDDDVVHENGRLAVVGEDTFRSLGEEERERRHSLEYAGLSIADGTIVLLRRAPEAESTTLVSAASGSIDALVVV